MTAATSSVLSREESKVVVTKKKSEKGRLVAKVTARESRKVTISKEKIKMRRKTM